MFSTIVKREAAKSPPLLFLHLPKCAGTSFANYLGQLYNAKDIHHIPAYQLRKSVALMQSSPMDNLADANAYRAATVLHAQSGILQNKQLILGHFYYHPVFDDQENNGHLKKITVLRHPVKRFISDFVYSRVTHKNDFQLADNFDLYKYLDSAHGREKLNCISHMIGGFDDSGEFTEADCNNRALQRLKEFDSVAVISDHVSLDTQLSRFLGHQVKLSKLNTIKEKSSDDAPFVNALEKLFNKSVQSELLQRCEPDMEIYNYFQRLNT